MITAEKTKTLFTTPELVELHEKINDSPRSLRDQLIEAPKTGETITLPKNSVTLEIHSSMILGEKDFPHEVFGYFAGLMQEFPDTFGEGPIGKEDGPFQLRLQHDPMTLGEMRQTVLDREEHNESPEDDSFKLNFLYSGDDEAETPELSGVLVFGDPTPEQIETLRAKLPEDVPLLNGTTNELLDETGRYERELGQSIRALRGYLASIALMSYFQKIQSESTYDTYTDPSADTPQPHSDTDDSPFTGNQNGQRKQDRQTDSGQGNTYDQQSPQSSYEEESNKAKLNREAVTLLNKEAQRLGVDSYFNLDRKGLKRVERLIFRQLHPDFNQDGNVELLQTVTDLIARRIGPMEPINPDKPTNKKTAPAPESQPEPDTPQETVDEAVSDEEDSLDTVNTTASQPLAIEAVPERKAITSTPHSEAQ